MWCSCFRSNAICCEIGPIPRLLSVIQFALMTEPWGPGSHPESPPSPTPAGGPPESSAFQQWPPAEQIEPSKPALRLTATGRAVALCEILLCSDFPTQVLLTFALTQAGLSTVDAGGQLSATYVITLSLLDTAVLVSLILLFLLVHGERPRAVFLGSRPARPEAVLGIALIPVALFVSLTLFTVISRFAPWLHNVPTNPLEALIRTPGLAVLFGVVGIVAGGFREELQRAFILRRFEQHLGGGWTGLAVFSVAFGAGHAIQGWDVAIITGTLGAGWGALYLVRRSIIAPLTSHAGFNLAEIVGHTLQ